MMLFNLAITRFFWSTLVIRTVISRRQITTMTLSSHTHPTPWTPCIYWLEHTGCGCDKSFGFGVPSPFLMGV